MSEYNLIQIPQKFWIRRMEIVFDIGLDLIELKGTGDLWWRIAIY